MDERKKQWLQIIYDNPNCSRGELRKINLSVHNYIHKYDMEWYDKVTPKTIKSVKGTLTDWDKKDKELLEKVKIAVNNIKNKEGKPIRICSLSIKRELAIERKLDNIKLLKTRAYIKTVMEKKEGYWPRKIKWGINKK